MKDTQLRRIFVRIFCYIYCNMVRSVGDASNATLVYSLSASTLCLGQLGQFWQRKGSHKRHFSRQKKAKNTKLQICISINLKKIRQKVPLTLTLLKAKHPNLTLTVLKTKHLNLTVTLLKITLNLTVTLVNSKLN